VLGSTPAKYGAAIGLAATTAAGVKPFRHDGQAPQRRQRGGQRLGCRGIGRAGLHRRGRRAQGEQGFLATHGDLSDVDSARPYDVLGPSDAVTQLLYKVHASCGGTHATIESVRAALARAGRADVPRLPTSR